MNMELTPEMSAVEQQEIITDLLSMHPSESSVVYCEAPAHDTALFNAGCRQTPRMPSCA